MTLNHLEERFCFSTLSHFLFSEVTVGLTAAYLASNVFTAEEEMKQERSDVAEAVKNAILKRIPVNSRNDAYTRWVRLTTDSLEKEKIKMTRAQLRPLVQFARAVAEGRKVTDVTREDEDVGGDDDDVEEKQQKTARGGRKDKVDLVDLTKNDEEGTKSVDVCRTGKTPKTPASTRGGKTRGTPPNRGGTPRGRGGRGAAQSRGRQQTRLTKTPGEDQNITNETC
jgi:hypothetical protein